MQKSWIRYIFDFVTRITNCRTRKKSELILHTENCHIFANHCRNRWTHLHFQFAIGAQSLANGSCCGLWGCDMWHIETKTENYFVQKHSSSVFARRAHTNAFHIPISLGSHVNVCANASIVGTYSVENMMKNNFFICTINNIVNFRIAEASHVYRYQSSAVVGCHCHCLSSPAIHFRQILPLFRCVLMRLNREVGYVNDCSGSACDDTFELGCTAAAKKSRNRKTF